MSDIQVTRWQNETPVTDEALLALFAAEGLTPYGWSNDPGDVYAAHVHPYHKVIVVAQGSITFGLPELGQEITLNAGDRLDLPANMLHDATVGPRGVVCLEGHREA
ncbi:MAG: cupin [Anaerolineae bacterium]|nr:cupin [Anaerolineae bacterium]